MTDHYDIAVLGSGPGGYIAALKAGQLGAKAAIIEKHYLGGTCLNYGCIPSKALLASAELAHRIRHGAELGVEAGEPTIRWDAIQKRKDLVVRKLRGGVKALLSGRNVTLYEGRGVLQNAHTLAVTGDKGETRTLTADKVILAVGSVPSRIPGWPDDPELVCTSDEALHWKTLPSRLLIVGGGVIGCEFACMMAAYGVQTTVVEMMPTFLPGLDGHLGKAIFDILKKRGIACYTDTKVEDLKQAGDGLEAVLGNGETLQVDRVLVATGRRPATDDIGLDQAGLSTDRGFVRVDAHLETPVKGIYCIGDANGQCLLAHAASAHGIAAVENALGHAREFTSPIPYAVYTFPEIAAVGLSQEQAREKGIPVAIGSFPFSYLGKAMTVNETDGFVKVVRHRETGELLGVHMLGHNVTESIHAASTMLHARVGAREAVHVIMSHPTMSEGLHEALDDSLGMALHAPPRKVIRVAG